MWQWCHTKTLTLVSKIKDKRKEKKRKITRNLGSNFVSLTKGGLAIFALNNAVIITIVFLNRQTMNRFIYYKLTSKTSEIFAVITQNP